MHALLMLFLASWGGSTIAWALPPLEWGELHLEETFTLLEPLAVGGIELARGETFRHGGTLLIPGVDVFLMDVLPARCPDPEAEAALAWKVPQGSTRRVGVALRAGCTVEVYIDVMDYFTPSFFGYH